MGGNSAVSNGGNHLPERLSAHIARCVKSLDRGSHILIGNDISRRIFRSAGE